MLLLFLRFLGFFHEADGTSLSPAISSLNTSAFFTHIVFIGKGKGKALRLMEDLGDLIHAA